jgi:hypothetical protein
VIFRTAIALSFVVLAASHQPDIGFGRPTLAVPSTGDTNTFQCNQSDTWLCGPLRMVEGLHDRIIAGADRVRDDFRAQHPVPLSGEPAF